MCSTLNFIRGGLAARERLSRGWIDVAGNSGLRSLPAVRSASALAAVALAGVAILWSSSASAQFFPDSRWSVYPGRYADPAPDRVIRRRTKASYPRLADAPKNDLKPQGPLLILVSIEQQRLKIYDDRGLFAESPISSGTKDHPTPMGVFSIIQKSKWHRSNLYSSAPMPFMQRITWSGVALHAGELPGYPASHGCIRLPAQFAARLWNWSKLGARVIVAPGELSVAEMKHKYLAKRLTTPLADARTSSAAVRTADASNAIQPQVTSDARAADTREQTPGIAAVKTDAERPAAAQASDDAKSVAETKADMSATAYKISDTQTGETKTDEYPAAEKAAAVTAPDEKSPGAASAESQAAPETDGQSARSVGTDVSPAVADAKPADAPAAPKAAAEPPASPAEKQAAIAPAAAPQRDASPEQPSIPAWMQLPQRSGQVAVLISRKDGKLYMRQNNDPVFETPVEFSSDAPVGTHLFTVRKAAGDDKADFEWSVVSLPGVTKTVVARKPGKTPSGKVRMKDVFTSTFGPTPASASQALDRVVIPQEALQRIAFNLTAGSSVLISDQSFSAGGETGRGTEFIVPLR